MKNKKKLSKALMIVLILALLSLILVTGTYSKYITELSGSDSATVAKWAWTIGTADIQKGTTTYTFNLFDSILDTVDDQTEGHVVSGKIAPGTKGSFEIKIANKSDVDATYAVTFTETNPLNANIQYSLDGQTYVDDISSLNISATEIAKTNGTASQIVYWQWEFDGDDTTVGFNAGTEQDATVTILAKLNLTQVD